LKYSRVIEPKLKGNVVTEYWFGYVDDEPRAIYRLVRGDGIRRDEYYDWSRNEWLPSDIYRIILNGEIGYEKATQEDAEEFMRTKNVKD
jgi:hypothetical protein